MKNSEAVRTCHVLELPKQERDAVHLRREGGGKERYTHALECSGPEQYQEYCVLKNGQHSALEKPGTDAHPQIECEDTCSDK